MSISGASFYCKDWRMFATIWLLGIPILIWHIQWVDKAFKKFTLVLLW
jgi:hypothetical protein